MVERYDILFNGRSIAKGYATMDQKRAGFKNVSIMPIDRSGDFAGGTLEIELKELITGSYPGSTPTEDALGELLGMATIEANKVKIVGI